MRWPLHVIGASGLLLLAFYGACATVPDRIPYATWAPQGAAAYLSTATSDLMEAEPETEVTVEDLREELQRLRVYRAEQQRAMGREMLRLSAPAPMRARPAVTRPASRRLPTTGVWSPQAEAQRAERRRWIDSELERRR